MRLTPVALCLALGLVGAARGADISWGTATTIAGDSDANTAGTLVMAYNIGNPSVAATTINGVTFAAFPVTDGSKSTTIGSLTVKGFGTDTVNSTSLLGSANSPFSTLSSNYRSMLSTGVLKSSSSVHILDVTLLGLTVGNSYTLQLWTNDSRATTNTGSVYDFNGNNKLMDDNTTNADGGVGQFILGTFVADATTEFFSVHGEPFDVATAELNGLQLRTAVPEPATACLCAIAATMLLTRRRLFCRPRQL